MNFSADSDIVYEGKIEFSNRKLANVIFKKKT